MKTTLTKNYTNPSRPVSYSGRNIVSRYTKIPGQRVTNSLAHHPSYVLHREVKRPRTYNPIILYSPRKLFQADLIDLASRSKDNDDVKYVLIVVDSFTRKCWARTLVDKTADRVLSEFKDIYKSSGKFERLMTDAGSEFIAKKFKAWMNKENIKFTRGNPHAPHVERLNRTIQSKLFRYMTENETRRWVDVLQRVVDAYNARRHRMIKMSPNEAEKKVNRAKVIDAVSRYYQKALSKRRDPKFKVGDVVSIQKYKNVFAKGYDQVFTDELFKIYEVHTKLPISMYTLTEYDGTVITGRFYENELQLAKYDVYKVEKVLKTRRRKGVSESFVKWKGWPDKYNQWIPDTDVVREYGTAKKGK